MRVRSPRPQLVILSGVGRSVRVIVTVVDVIVLGSAALHRDGVMADAKRGAPHGAASRTRGAGECGGGWPSHLVRLVRLDEGVRFHVPVPTDAGCYLRISMAPYQPYQTPERPMR